MTGVAGWMRAARRIGALALALPMMVSAHAAFADKPTPWQLDFQQPATPVSAAIVSLHNEVLVIITLITLFVVALLLYVIVRFNAKRHPVAAKTTHNTVLEVLWTVVPVLILVLIAVPSFKLLYFEGHNAHAEMTIKITGHQWYWTYDYPDQGDLSFDSNMIPDEDAVKAGKPRLLAVDNPLVVPVGTVIRVLVTGTDVIHSWFVPSFGVQEYAVEGRLNEAWMTVNTPGTYYGQCNQICGINHPFMPIQVIAMAKDDFAKWLAQAQKDHARNNDGAGAVELAAQAAH
jgi:cytochrome c oxidase subunit 2